MSFKNRFLSGGLAILLTFGSICISADAAGVVEVPASEVNSVYNQKVESNSVEDWPDGPQIYSESGIVMDMDSGAILYAKNIDDKHYPASITKVATALIALQNYGMDEIVKFTSDDISFLEYGDAHIGIKPGEELVMEDAMYGMMLASANEVSHGIGAHMEGGYDKFIEVMNETTKALGCENSNWVNTYGLHDKQHYTTVRDMAIIGSAAFKFEKFREIINTYQHVIPKTNITKQKRYVHQNHKMIREWDNRYYEYCVGGKTGYTDQALTTLVTFATKGEMNLIAVVMRTHGGGNNAYKDTRAMLQYGFKKFQRQTVTQDMIGEANIANMEQNAVLTLPKDVVFEQLTKEVTFPTEMGDRAGAVTYFYNGQEVGTIEMTITEEYYNDIHGIIDEIEEVKREKKQTLPIYVVVLLVVIGGILLAVAALFGFVYYKRKKLEKRRRQRRLEYGRQRDK